MVSSLFNCTYSHPSPVFVSQFLPPSSFFPLFLSFRGVLIYSSKARSGNSLLYIDAKLCRSILRRATLLLRLPSVTISRSFLFSCSLAHDDIYIFICSRIDPTVDWSIEKNHRLYVYACIYIYINVYIYIHRFEKFMEKVWCVITVA